MRLTDWLVSFTIIIIFSGIAVYSLITRRYDDIKKDWPKYRCNPIMIPLAGQFGEDPFDTFSSCIVGTSSNFVNSALLPITQGIGSLVKVAKKQEESQNNSRFGSFSLRAAFSSGAKCRTILVFVTWNESPTRLITVLYSNISHSLKHVFDI